MNFQFNLRELIFCILFIGCAMGWIMCKSTHSYEIERINAEYEEKLRERSGDIIKLEMWYKKEMNGIAVVVRPEQNTNRTIRIREIEPPDNLKYFNRDGFLFIKNTSPLTSSTEPK